jgi:hypothetical protein
MDRHTQNAVYEKYGFKCFYCGTTEKTTYQVEHRLPRSKGGTDDLENLVVACVKCNYEKMDSVSEEWKNVGLYTSKKTGRQKVYMKPELEIAARIGITPEAYKVLRKLKTERKQSMVRIVSDLILNVEEKIARATLL